MPTIRVTKALLIQFTIRNNLTGQVDTVATATPGSTNTQALKTVINPSNPREAAAVALSLTGVNPQNPIVAATITANGHTAQVGITLAAAPDLGSVTIDLVGPEIDVPDWAV